MEDTIQFRIEQSYLEQARSCLQTEVVQIKGTTTTDPAMSPNLMYALVAQTYIFSYLALLSFISIQVGILWKAQDAPLQKRFPKAKDLQHLLNSDLKEVKDAIKIICEESKIEKLHEADPILWNELINVLKPVRDFLSHPYANSEEFNKIMDEAMTKHSWNFPSKVAEKVISYFYEKTSRPTPDWVKQNQDFAVQTIKIKPL